MSTLDHGGGIPRPWRVPPLPVVLPPREAGEAGRAIEADGTTGSTVLLPFE